MCSKLVRVGMILLLSITLGSCVSTKQSLVPRPTVGRDGGGLYYQYEIVTRDEFTDLAVRCRSFSIPPIPTLPKLPPLSEGAKRDPELLNQILVEHLASMRKLYRKTAAEVRDSYYKYEVGCKHLQP